MSEKGTTKVFIFNGAEVSFFAEGWILGWDSACSTVDSHQISP